MPAMPKFRSFTARLIALTLAALLATACATKGDSPPPPPAGVREDGSLILTRADNNRSTELRVGERLIVRLPENPTTGYTWAIDETDSRLLALDSTDYVPPETGSIGARGQRTFVFTARQSGEVALKFKYWRFWEGDASVTERFVVNLRVLP
ncbi:MAG: protease inhibitor I42 family protein [Candidatus Contendobacter sp.]|nr:protease inhibitor I42 family protein [Candidatus Contendobacter sp.]